MAKTCKNNLPKSALGKAIGYCIPRWGNLLNYLKDDHLEIDINLAENAIEPIAVCRKNHLFAGSSKNGEIAAMFYSFFATCEENQVHPFQWFKLPQNR